MFYLRRTVFDADDGEGVREHGEGTIVVGVELAVSGGLNECRVSSVWEIRTLRCCGGQRCLLDVRL